MFDDILAKGKASLETVVSIHWWTDRLFTFETTKPPGYIFAAGQYARLGLPEGLLGLSPGGGGTQRLIRSLGRHVTAELVLTAWRMKGERAYQLGLAAAIAEPEALLGTAIEKARAMLKVAPLALTEMKRLVRIGADAALPTALALEQEVLFRLYVSNDGQEGIEAFLDKRSPNFKGA